jgi:AcrB/AcrD/AcrF family
VKTKGRLLDEKEFGDIVVRTNPDGSQVFLKDVARLELGTMLYNSIGRHNSGPSAVIAVFQIPGTNALQVAESIKKTMDDLSTRFPRDMEYLISLDTTLPVAEGINEIVHTLFEAVALVILVVFVFLQNWRATLIPLVTVPVSLSAPSSSSRCSASRSTSFRCSDWCWRSASWLTTRSSSSRRSCTTSSTACSPRKPPSRPWRRSPAPWSRSASS